MIDAIKLVFASTFFADSKAYLAATPNRIEEEKMGVMIQQLVGQTHGDHFYPTFAGVARSYNFYPIGDILPEEGLVAAAMGLGRTVVDGGKCLRFSPAHPQRLFQFSTVEETLANSQREFWALDLTVNDGPLRLAPEANLARLDLSVAEQDEQLYALGSVYDPNSEAIFDGISRPGVRLVSFAGVLKGKVFPLPELLRYLLDIGQTGFNGPVELEFAVELDPVRKLKRLSFLQIRPLIAEVVDLKVDLFEVDGLDPLCRTPTAMGNGVIEDISDIVYVHPLRLDRNRTAEVAKQIERFNLKLVEEGRSFLLIGPGRWGSADPWLGIPVNWSQISGARTIVECDLADYKVTPSQGTHFFQNIVSFGVGYLTINEGSGHIDWDWLEALPALAKVGPVRHLRLEEPISVLMDGRTGQGAVLEPA